MRRTLAIIKPDAVRKNIFGCIISAIEEAGFRILAMKYIRISTEQAAEFYAVHKEQPFYKDLIEFMTKEKIIPMVLEKDNAIEDFRTLIGNKNPALAEEGTIRKKYGETVTYNSIHGSDSLENSEKEISFFFSKSEIMGNCTG